MVTDASILAPAMLWDDERGEHARAAMARSRSAHAPEVSLLETVSAARNLHRAQLVTTERAHRAVERLVAAPIQFYSHRSLLRIIWTLRDRCSSYDAAYVALARALDAPLVTADQRLARAVEDICEIELVADAAQ